MALPAGFLDELRARTPIAAIVGRRVRLAKSGRNWKGCCPFHNEKTPSFYVYEDGFHCFGCGAHGDAISFVMQTQGASFPEAVQALAGEAGMEVPKPTPEAAEAERRRSGLNEVMDAARDAFQRRLRLPEARRARDYLAGRGMTEATIERFALGWSGDGRGSLVADLARAGIGPEQLVEAGLLRAEEGRPAAEFFFNRVMFPIRDRQGRTISFGARILGDGQPKYLNGPETALFSKRRTLFGLDFAREAARGGAALVAVEGYTDVIALHQAGFGGAVAPLGTALTEDQLEELWRVSPVPVLCFDGDDAGGRAAARVAELALPMLSAERSLRLATLPAGEDPDSMIRRHGSAAFQEVLDRARPVTAMLFELTRARTGDATPEQRAALRALLEATAGRIGDKFLASEVRRSLLDAFYARPRAALGPRSTDFRTGAARKMPPAFLRPVPTASVAAAERARTMVAILLRHPELLHDVEEAFAGIALSPPLEQLRTAILSWGETAEMLDSAALNTHLTQIGLATQVGQALSAVPVPLPACAASDAMPAEAEAGWWHFFGLMNPVRLEEEVAAAMRDFTRFEQDAAADEPDGPTRHRAIERRLIALCAARNALRHGEDAPDSED